MKNCYLLSALMFLAVNFTTNTAWAEEDTRPNDGSFSTSVDIKVPSFQNIEPQLSLNYSSAGDNGQVGLGWSLSGLSEIERASVGKGAPKYNTSDIFLFDGQELIACTTGMVSPSCSTGGSHTSKVESYQRFTFDATANEWTITGTEGTRYVYRAMLGHDKTQALGTFRWGLSSVIDTHANQVDYAYWCDGVNDCYPDTATYNGSTVKFYWETRDDSLSFATGRSVLLTSSRLKTIDVLVGTERLNVYSLTYDANLSDRYSRLVSVKTYGRDAVFDESGLIISGTSLPESTFEWSSPVSGELTSENWGQPCPYPTIMGDFNGDGNDDLYCSRSSNHWTALSNGDGTFAPAKYWTSSYVCQNSTTSHVQAVDFNADGKDDLYCVRNNRDNTYSYNYYGISRGDGTFSFTSDPYRQKVCTDNPYGAKLVGDFNGNGKSDIFCRTQATREANNGDNYYAYYMSIAWSNGQGAFSVSSIGRGCQDAPVTLGDFNGDGKTDIYCYTSHYADDIFLSNGNGTFRQINSSFKCKTSGSGTGDFNGDGKADLYCKNYNYGQATVALSRGNGHFTIKPAAAFCGDYSYHNKYGTSLTSGDFDGDGKTDLMCHVYGYKQNFVNLGNGDGTFRLVKNYAWCTENPRAVELNGDGRTDLFCPQSNDIHVTLFNGQVPSLITQTKNSVGGTTKIEYTPSSEWANTNNPPVRQTVSAITIEDGRGQSERTTYAYAGGLYDRVNKEFLGFKTVTSTQACLAGETSCPYQVTSFRQDLVTKGAVEKVERFDGTGKLLRQSDYAYDVNLTTLPYTSFQIGSTQTVFEGTASKQTGSRTTYDEFGNVLTNTNLGDLSVLGDELTSVTTYVPNTSDYLVSLAAKVEVYEGVGATGDKLQESRNLYDNATIWNSMPTQGDLTESQVWLDTENRFISTRTQYNAQGNVLSSFDALGARTDYIYDPVHTDYVIETRLPLYAEGDTRHKSRIAWDFVCGTKLSTTNANNQTTTYQYDKLCRSTRVDLPSGNFTISSYHNYGDPQLQHTRVETSGPAGQANLWKNSYFDGFERSYKTTQPGSVAGVVIQSLTEFNARGSVSRSSDNHRVGGTPRWTSYQYDGLDRTVLTTQADGRTTALDYALGPFFGQVIRTNAIGRETVSHTDAYGRTVQSEAYLNGQVVTSHYQFDELGRLIGIEDDAGNSWMYHHDSLGRKLLSDDPDLGLRSYVYDDAGRVVSSTDALEQVTQTEYDSIGRVLNRTSRYGTLQAETTTYTYDEARTGYFNVGYLTTLSNAHQVTVHNYDNAGRGVKTTHQVDGQAYDFTNGYDVAGRVLWQAYPDGDQVGSPTSPFLYNAAGQLTTIPGIVDDITYNDYGQATQKRLANGVITDFGYNDDNGWLTSINTQSINTLLANTVIQDLTYAHDSLGLIKQVSSAHAKESWVYEYDDLYRLTRAANADDLSLTQTFDYDSLGNMTYNSKVGDYAYPMAGEVQPHAVQSAGAHSYTYDANGNMRMGNGRSITYDGLNRPTTINDSSFVYGPSKRLKKTENGITTLTIGNLEIRAGVTTTYLPGDAKRRDGHTYWLHKDHLGSVQAVTDATGSVMQRYTYAAFGEQLSQSSTHIETRSFLGEIRDDSGLMFLNARYYDPVLARFISADPSHPLARGVGLNRYSYSFNNPVMLSDASGLAATSKKDKVSAARDKRARDKKNRGRDKDRNRNRDKDGGQKGKGSPKSKGNQAGPTNVSYEDPLELNIVSLSNDPPLPPQQPNKVNNDLLAQMQRQERAAIEYIEEQSRWDKYTNEYGENWDDLTNRAEHMNQRKDYWDEVAAQNRQELRQELYEVLEVPAIIADKFIGAALDVLIDKLKDIGRLNRALPGGGAPSVRSNNPYAVLDRYRKDIDDFAGHAIASRARGYEGGGGSGQDRFVPTEEDLHGGIL